MKAPVDRLVVLDGLRGVAAITVLVFHLHIDALQQFDRGYLMVDLFFILSGFVLTLAVEPRLNQGWGWHRFMLARYRRLLPVVAVGVLLGAAAFALYEDTPWGLRSWGLVIVMGLLLIPTVWTTQNPLLFPLNGAHWSLFFELVANLVHALVLQRLNLKQLLIALTLFAAGLIWSIFEAGGNTSGAYQDYYYLAFIRVGFSYIAGIILARLWRERGSSARIPWPVVLASPLAILLAIELLPLWLGELVAVMLAWPLVIWLGASSTAPARSVGALGWLGEISYPLYATHGPLIAFQSQIWPSNLGKLLVALLCLACAAIVAILLDRKRLERRLHEAKARSAKAGD